VVRCDARRARRGDVLARSKFSHPTDSGTHASSDLALPARGHCGGGRDHPAQPRACADRGCAGAASLSEADPRAGKGGGRPYWAEGRDYPVGANGAPLHLLAQIDFAELPPSLDGYPKAGLLQFFIAANDHYGADFDSGMTVDAMSAQRNFRVVYWPDTRAEPRDVDVPATDSLPHDPARPRRKRFSAATETLGVHDHRFDRLLGGDAHATIETYARAHHLDADALFDAVHERNGRGGHKIGGYPFFTQQDPRTDDDRLELLLQLDTDDQMMWGDSGVGGFFIAPEDLARGDFSRVMYSWDCY
jgi:uncharacterized protein YwqG